MPARLSHIVHDALDVEVVASFWAQVLGWEGERDDDGDMEVRDPSGRNPVALLVLGVAEPKAVKNRVHLDLAPEDDDQRAELSRLLTLGAREVDIGQGEQRWIVLADPEGNEFCLLHPRAPAAAAP